VRAGTNIVVLSDRAGEGEVPIPSLLSLGSVHNHLNRKGLRTSADILVECGDAITPHDFACLVGYSASGIYPYLAFDCIDQLVEKAAIDLDVLRHNDNFRRAVTSGIVGIMTKMVIPLYRATTPPRIFEIVGFAPSRGAQHRGATTSLVGRLSAHDIDHEANARF
jgi:glutamate synthase (ferredoxin)